MAKVRDNEKIYIDNGRDVWYAVQVGDYELADIGSRDYDEAWNMAEACAADPDNDGQRIMIAVYADSDCVDAEIVRDGEH